MGQDGQDEELIDSYDAGVVVVKTLGRDSEKVFVAFFCFRHSCLNLV